MEKKNNLYINVCTLQKMFALKEMYSYKYQMFKKALKLFCAIIVIVQTES